ncbi:hypothetical protein PVL29_000140 [Vitis rotundifolia]|uniref:Uncharacterized protein n=1 Tax=Vitis rotundifolia TaxID=103349 RepID=A0AA39AI39_VITRO|nr:hypothetical protein PVL29_000140 [Vitis rotundifolia]
MLMRFSNYMDDFLCCWEPNIFSKKFKLRTLCIPNIDRYIDFALEKHVQDMEVNYNFLGIPLSINSSIFCLDLGLQNFILSDSLIEELSLNDYYVPKTIKVLSEKLLLLKLANCMKLRDIEIDAPNLQSFTYDGGHEPCEINVGALESLKSLSLKNALSTDSWIEENILKFISLQNLSINGCNKNLKKVKISHGKLKNFEFVNCGNKVELELKLITPNLVSFFYTGILPLHTVIISTQFKAKLLMTQISTTIEWFLALRHLLIRFNHCKVLILEFKKFKYVKKVAEEDSSCCKHLPVKCWRHYSTNITMENFEDIDDKESLVMFFKDSMKMSSNTRIENVAKKLILSHIH